MSWNNLNGYDEMLEQANEGRDFLCELDGDPEGYEPCISKEVEELVTAITDELDKFSEKTNRKTYIEYEEEYIKINLFRR